MQDPQVLYLQFFRQGGRVNLVVKDLAGFEVVAGLGIKVAQFDGGFVVALAVGQLERQDLGVFQIDLGGVEAEGEEVGRGNHLQFVAAGGVFRGRYEPSVCVQLVLFLGDVKILRGKEAVQFVKLLPGAPIRAGRCGAGGGPDGRQQDENDAPSAVHTTKIIKSLQRTDGLFDFLFAAFRDDR